MIAPKSELKLTMQRNGTLRARAGCRHQAPLQSFSISFLPREQSIDMHDPVRSKYALLTISHWNEAPLELELQRPEGNELGK